jgi:hypothetical protein
MRVRQEREIKLYNGHSSIFIKCDCGSAGCVRGIVVPSTNVNLGVLLYDVVPKYDSLVRHRSSLSSKIYETHNMCTIASHTTYKSCIRARRQKQQRFQGYTESSLSNFRYINLGVPDFQSSNEKTSPTPTVGGRIKIQKIHTQPHPTSHFPGPMRFLLSCSCVS